MNGIGGNGPEPDICWQAVFSRDARFDGRFFAGAVTTGIYCRSTCPVPFARPDNITWFPSAAAAERAGFRPCQRCRSAAPPGTPAWLGTSAVVSRALRLITEGALDSGDLVALADRVGLGARHLRRLFVEHLGASPVRIAITRRVHFARNLIEETNLPITELAAYSGFRSIRQFNHAIRSTTGESPTQLRRLRGASVPTPTPGLLIRLPYRPPFHWAALLAFLESRAIAGVESIRCGAYRRTGQVDGVAGIIQVQHDEAQRQLSVTLELPRYDPLMEVVERVRRMFDLTADPFQIADQLSRDSMLRPLVNSHEGLRVPGIWDGFEAAVRAILGEGLTKPTRRAALTRFARMFGKPLKASTGELTHIFPSPQDVAEADLAAAGIRGHAAITIRALAKATLAGELTFQASMNLADAIARLRVVRGISRRAAEYIAMRAFGEPDAFPVPSGKVPRGSEHWRPWRAYAAMHLLRADWF